MCQRRPLPGAILCEKNIICMRPRVCKGQTDKGDVSIFIICMYFIFHTGKSGSLHVSANAGSCKSLSLNKILFQR